MLSKLVRMLFTMQFLFPLVVDGQWSTWSSWSTCSPDCKHHRRRLCDNPAQENGGKYCSGTDLDTANCTGAMCKGRLSSTFVEFTDFWCHLEPLNSNRRQENSSVLRLLPVTGPRGCQLSRYAVIKNFDFNLCSPDGPLAEDKNQG